MNIQRLKHAWARGARVQRQRQWHNGNPSSAWMQTELVDEDARIHPDDEHLQYGPVSTALRDMALFTDSVELDEITEMFMDLAGSNWFVFSSWVGTAQSEHNLHCDFARLFMAELLADEGL